FNRIRTKPEIPVQSGRDSLSLQIPILRRTSYAYHDSGKPADGPAANQVHRLPEFVRRPLHATGLKHAIVFTRCINHRPSFFYSQGKGLLAIDILPRTCGVHSL